jgi:hypothetical protein
MRAGLFSLIFRQRRKARGGLRLYAILLFAPPLLWLCGGCAVYRSIADRIDPPSKPTADKAATKDGSGDTANKMAASDGKPGKKNEKKPDGTDSEAMKQMMAEIEKVGDIDPAARDELMKDLKQSDPSLWPMEIRAYRAVAAYHERHSKGSADVAASDRGGLGDGSRPDLESGSKTAAAVDKSSLSDDPAAQTHHAKITEISASGAITVDGKPHNTSASSSIASPSPASATMTPAQTTNLLALAPENIDTEIPVAPNPATVTASAVSTGASSSASVTAHSADNTKAKNAALQAMMASAFTKAHAGGTLPLTHSIETAPGITGGSGANAFKPAVASAAAQNDVQQASYLASMRPTSSDSIASAMQIALAGSTMLGGSGDRSLPVAGDVRWQDHLAETIHSLEANHAGGGGEGEIALQARLRMLYLLAGRRDEAMRPLPSAPKASQDYWTKQIYGLSTWLDTQGTPDSARRAAATKQILDEALARLSESAPLGVRNLSFCSAVKSYGSIKLFASNDFVAGQEVLLYAEVENFVVEQTAKGNHTSLKVSYQIFDSRGQRVATAERESPPVEEYCQSPRHDFFVSYGLFLPKHPYPGPYKLQLTVEDMIGHKVGQATVDFTLKGE